jgi:hypothetical protein
MGANLQQIAKYLDKLGWDYRFDDEEDRIITGVEAENLEDFLIVVQLDEEGKFFRVFAPQVLAGVKDHPFDTPRDKSTGILSSSSPLNLNPLQFLNQRWFFP